VKTLRFEPLTQTHLESIMKIEKEANSAPWSEKSFLNELDNPHSTFLVALEGGEVAGYGGFWACVDEAHITTVAVRDDLRRKGVGKRLMVELLNRAQKAGLLCSTLEVRAGNTAAIGLYEQLGYVQTARRKAYYPDNKEDAVVMWLHDLQDWWAKR
jgi:[ribosomal protein S18]-alanine N-acetyltransferase